MKIRVRLSSRWRSAAYLAVLTAALTLPHRARASGRWETLEAIHRVENPHDSRARGRHGELGAFQFRPATWRMHTKLPFERALDRATAEMVAVRHYEWIRKGLVRNGLADTPYNIALAWNGGLWATVRGKTASSSHDYAERVANIVTHLRESRLAAAE